MPTTIEDRDEILQLLDRYNHAVDRGDAEGWADTFAEGGVFDAMGQVLTGRDALVGFASSVKGVRHVVVNPLVDVHGDGAHVRAYLMLYAGGAIAMMGVYEDDLVRTPDGWRFAKRVFTVDPPATT